MPDKFNLDSEMLELLGVLELKSHDSTDIFLTNIDRKLNPLIVGVFDGPELLAFSRIENDVDIDASTEAKEGSDLVLSNEGATIMMQ